MLEVGICCAGLAGHKKHKQEEGSSLIQRCQQWTKILATMMRPYASSDTWSMRWTLRAMIASCVWWRPCKTSSTSRLLLTLGTLLLYLFTAEGFDGLFAWYAWHHVQNFNIGSFCINRVDFIQSHASWKQSGPWLCRLCADSIEAILPLHLQYGARVSMTDLAALRLLLMRCAKRP